MSGEEKIKNFDPNGVGNKGSNIFGLPFTVEEAQVVVLPVPWDVTVSYGSGTSRGPEAVLNASYQVDLYDPDVRDAWKMGIAMEEVPHELLSRNDKHRQIASEYIRALEEGRSQDEPELKEIATKINKECEDLNSWVKSKVQVLLDQGKLVALLGGEHSTPLGYFQALNEKKVPFSILQIDAHADLRDAYEGFKYSHASIMHNAMSLPYVEKLVQVGVRDYCEEEVKFIEGSSGRVVTFFDRELKRAAYKGRSWETICQEIVQTLTDEVYLSFDIDGLDPKLCPHTGTPVPGGLEFEQALFLIEAVVKSGKKIIGLDLNEVSPGEGEWDASVGARLLFRLCTLMGVSQGKMAK